MPTLFVYMLFYWLCLVNQWNRVALELTIIYLLLATYEGIEQRVEGCGVVVVAGVAELVKDDELTKVFGQKHDEERYAYAVASTT